MEDKEITLKLVEEDKYKGMNFKQIFLMNSKRFFKNRECEKQFISETKNKETTEKEKK